MRAGRARDRSRDASGVTAAEAQPSTPNHPIVDDVEQPAAEETREDVFVGQPLQPLRGGMLPPSHRTVRIPALQHDHGARVSSCRKSSRS